MASSASTGKNGEGEEKDATSRTYLVTLQVRASQEEIDVIVGAIKDNKPAIVRFDDIVSFERHS